VRLGDLSGARAARSTSSAVSALYVEAVQINARGVL